MTAREYTILGGAAGIAVLAGPRRTRPLAGFLYGLALSRAHGLTLRGMEGDMRRLFAQRTSVKRRLEKLEQLLNEHGHRMADIEIVTRSGHRVSVHSPSAHRQALARVLARTEGI